VCFAAFFVVLCALMWFVPVHSIAAVGLTARWLSAGAVRQRGERAYRGRKQGAWCAVGGVVLCAPIFCCAFSVASLGDGAVSLCVGFYGLGRRESGAVVERRAGGGVGWGALWVCPCSVPASAFCPRCGSGVSVGNGWGGGGGGPGVGLVVTGGRGGGPVFGVNGGRSAGTWGGGGRVGGVVAVAGRGAG